MNGSTLWIVALPPVAGGIIGYFTNDVAIKMLFRPYRAIKVGGKALPFTPGLIPRNQTRLAQKVSDAIMTSLLTPEELQAIAQRLLQTERIQGVILWLLRLALDQVKADKKEKTAAILALILHDFASQSLPRLVAELAERDDFLEGQLDQIFDQIVLDLKLSENQAQQLSDWILDDIFPAKTLRSILTDFLTDRNIATLDEGFRSRTSGTYWLVANTVGAESTLVRFRTFMIEEPRAAKLVLQDLIASLGMRQGLTEWFSGFSLQTLPNKTLKELRRAFRESVRSYTVTRGAQVLEKLTQSLDWDETAKVLVKRLSVSEAVVDSLESISEELALILERYLEGVLEQIVAKALPILNLDQVIQDRVNQTPPEDLETAIQGIVKTELQAIVNLGGVLGILIGLLQSVLLLLR
ncbi:MAG: DUF445 family protein [Thermosynechococcaceae cyanobacterium]